MTRTSVALNPNFHTENKTFITKRASDFFPLLLQQKCICVGLFCVRSELSSTRKLLVYKYHHPEMRPRGDDEWAYFPKQKADLDTAFFFPFPKCQVGHHFSLASHLATDRLILACANRSPDLQPTSTANHLLHSSENHNPFTGAPVIWSNSTHPSPPLIGQLSQVLTQGVQLAWCYLGMNWLKPFSIYEPFFNDVGDNTCNSSQSGDWRAQLLPR